VIAKELHDPAIGPKNAYVLLSLPSSLKVLISRLDLRSCRGTRVKRTLVPFIECVC
jgi:hypothetical protein